MAVGFQEDDQLDDATRAFDDLRAEVAVLRRAVEALGPALKENRSPDYSLILGQIAWREDANARGPVAAHAAARPPPPSRDPRSPPRPGARASAALPDPVGKRRALKHHPIAGMMVDEIGAG